MTGKKVWLKLTAHSLLIAVLAVTICLVAPEALDSVPIPVHVALLAQEDGPKAQADVLFTEGRALVQKRQLRPALLKFEQALSIYREVGDRSREAESLLWIGYTKGELADHTGALEAYDAGLLICRELGKREWEGATLNNIGYSYSHLGQYEEALAYYRKALIIAREVGDLAGEGAILNNIGEAYYRRGQRREALDYLEQALTIRREIGDRRGIGQSLNNIGAVYDHLGQYEEALAYFQQALKIAREIDDRAGEGISLNNIGGIYHDWGEYEEALQYYEQALDIRREIGDRAGEGVVLNNIGGIYHYWGEYEVALSHYRQALSIHREFGNQAEIGESLNCIGGVYDSLGQHEEALGYYEQALSIRREIGDRVGEGNSLNNIGSIYGGLGRYEEALAYYRKALTIAREVGDRRGICQSLNGIGVVYFLLSRYEDARAHFQQAQGIALEIGDRKEVGNSLHNMGLIYESLGQYEQALQHYEQALAIRREIGDRAGEGISLTSVGVVYYRLGQHERALGYHEEALDILRAVGDRAGEGANLNNIGVVYISLGQHEEALGYCEQALAIRREIGDQAGEANSLNNIGICYQAQGLYEDALRVYEQALVVVREAGTQTGEGVTLANIGLTYEQQGRLEQAADYYEQAMDVLESVRAVAGTEAGRAGFIAQYAGLYSRAVGLYHQQGEEARAFHTSERGRARAFLDSLATGQVQLADDAAADLLTREQESYALRRAAQEALARTRALEPPDPDLIADLEAQLSEAEKDYSDALAAIEMRGGQLAALVSGRNTVLELSDVQALLDDHTTLVSYYVLGDEGTLAFVITEDSFTVIELPEATPENLWTALGNLYRWLNPENPHPLPLRSLYSWLVAPLCEHLHTQLVCIIPNLQLHYVPFAALTNGETYFGQQHTLFTLPSASVLPFIRDNAADVPGAGALVFGDPATGNPGLRPLVHSAAEAMAVAERLGVPFHIGLEASENRLRSGVGGVGVVHLAAHGSFNVVAPLHSAIHLAPGGGHNGLLEVYEIYSLDLKETDLVALSACESYINDLAVGDEGGFPAEDPLAMSAGDELEGLTRALFFAGAPTIIGSLWSVDDAATEELMVAFYLYLQAGMSKAEALQAAQAEVREAYPGPFYWAAFILSGDPGAAQKTPAPTTKPSCTPLAETSSLPASKPTRAPASAALTSRGGRVCGIVGAATVLVLFGFWATQQRRRRIGG